MKKLALLCDLATQTGGAERYWATVIPRLRERYDLRVFARVVDDGDPFGVPVERIAWSGENEPPSREGARAVSQALRGFDFVTTANVFDSLALHAVRASGIRWNVKIHDHRVYCPNGNKVYPQFPGVCHVPMGAACVANTVLHGCVRGPRVSSMRRIARRMRVRDVLAGSDAVVVSGPYMRDLCVQNGFAAGRIHALPPPLADEFFEAEPSDAGSGVLYAGRIEEEKGLKSLVRAMATIAAPQRPELIVAGRGSDAYERGVRETAERSNVRVTWLGFLQQEQLRDAIDRARVFALPSLWPEPFGLSGTQALARGRPVAAYDVGGVGSWLANAGIPVKRGDERALGAAIERLHNDRDAWARAASSARLQAQQYRLHAHVGRYEEIIEGP